MTNCSNENCTLTTLDTSDWILLSPHREDETLYYCSYDCLYEEMLANGYAEKHEEIKSKREVSEDFDPFMVTSPLTKVDIDEPEEFFWASYQIRNTIDNVLSNREYKTLDEVSEMFDWAEKEYEKRIKKLKEKENAES